MHCLKMSLYDTFLLIFRSRNGSHSDFGITFTQGDISRNPVAALLYCRKLPAIGNRPHIPGGKQNAISLYFAGVMEAV